MHLDLFVDSNDEELKNKYKYSANEHNKKVFNNPDTYDSGFDLFVPKLNKKGFSNSVKAVKSDNSNNSNNVFAASFKHTSPAGVAMASTSLEAYCKARDCDPLCSFGDFIAISHTVDEETAEYIKTEVSDGIIAPDYTPKALEILKEKKAKDLTGDGKIDSNDYLKARSIAIQKAKAKKANK